MTRPHRWPTGPLATRLGFGADYNPEQWPREVWAEDAALMQRAGVNVVTVGVFSWSWLQPAPDEFTFGWLDDVLDLLHAHGIGVDLATATATPPPWLTTMHPEVLPVRSDGATMHPGSRQHWRPTSPVFRRYALDLTRALARRYADHPALVAWHVSNELGCHNAYDYSPDAEAAFRGWLRDRHGTLAALNESWGTAFWSQRYTAWDQVQLPRLAATFVNPTQQLDFLRFSSDALLDHVRAERAVLDVESPSVPITTNFMVMGETRQADYTAWADAVDFVSNDHYRTVDDDSLLEQSFSASLTGGIARGLPWFLMEHSTSAVQWQPVNRAKAAGELTRDALVHVAHGADAICYFQWRQSVAGAEKYHSAMVPHAGPDTEVFREVTRLGALLGDLAGVHGSDRVPARVAILFDWDSWWASELDSHPTDRLRYRREALDWFGACFDLGVCADVVPVERDLAPYEVVVAPVLHVVPAALAERLTASVRDGTHLAVTYFSGIVDEHDHIWPGGYPGALRGLLGVAAEEFTPLQPGEVVHLDDGTAATLWAERITHIQDDVEVRTRYVDGPASGLPAVTTRAVGAGSATYVSTRAQRAGLHRTVADLLERAGVTSDLPDEARGAVEVRERRSDAAHHRFLVNHTDEDVSVGRLRGAPVISVRASVDDGVGVLGPRGVLVLELTADNDHRTRRSS